MNSFLDDLPNEKAVPTRYLRSQQPKEVSPRDGDQAGGADEDAANDGTAEGGDEFDPETLIPVVDISKQIPTDYWTMIVILLHQPLSMS